MTMLDKVRTDRMRVLADFLVSDEVGEFDLRNWQTRAFVPGRKFGPFVAREECGFAGCAIGWAIHKRLFEGLRFAPGRLEFRGPDIRLNGYAGWDAINELFGLPKRGGGELAGYFFAASAYETVASPGHVAARLRRAADIIDARRARARKPLPVVITRLLAPV